MAGFKMTENEKGIVIGMCIALAHIIREGHTDMAINIINDAGLTVEEIIEAEVDTYDAMPVIEVIKEK